jgi:hypothetical protein
LTSLNASSPVSLRGLGLGDSATAIHPSAGSLGIRHGRMRELDTLRWNCGSESTLALYSRRRQARPRGRGLGAVFRFGRAPRSLCAWWRVTPAAPA